MLNCNNKTIIVTPSIIDYCTNICANTTTNDMNKCICSCIYDNNASQIIGNNLIVFLFFIMLSGFVICLCGIIRVKIQRRITYRQTNNNNINNTNNTNSINNSNMLLSDDRYIVNYYTLYSQKSNELPAYNSIDNTINDNTINDNTISDNAISDNDTNSTIILPPNYSDINIEQELSLPPRYNNTI